MSIISSINCTLLTIGLFAYTTVVVIMEIIMWFVPRSFKRVSIRNKIVLITGGGSGLGCMVAQRLAKQGAIIVSWDINSKGNDETVQIIRKTGEKCHAYTVDVTDRHAVYACAERVKAEVGKVDILINNAGIVYTQHLMEASDEQIIKTFDVNIISHFWIVKSFLPEMMKENSGHIVTVSSVAGMVGSAKMIDYSSSKFAAVGFHESLFIDLSTNGYDGIHSTVICPYFTNTGMFDGVKSRSIPMLEPDYVADEMTDAILTRAKSLIMPCYIWFYLVFKGLMPYSCILLAYKIFTGKSSMRDFTGHKAVQRERSNS